MTQDEMIRIYNELTASEGYILGFVHEHQLYYIRIEHLPREILKPNKASSKRGGFMKVQVRCNSQFRHECIASGQAILLGSEEIVLADSKYNKGEKFEKTITETLTAETWVKDSVPFNVAGDIELDGKQIQIKFDGAELTNERTLMRVMTA